MLEVERPVGTTGTCVSGDKAHISHCNLVWIVAPCDYIAHAKQKIDLRYFLLIIMHTHTHPQSFGQQYSKQASGPDKVQSTGLGTELPDVRLQA